MRDMPKICPRCGNATFVVTAHVTQDWLVDADGNFVEEKQSCVEVTHAPDDGDIWTCAVCGLAEPGSGFERENG